ncbi:hypothetical protein A176_003729 [Myxococcus hansupus]|uniref:Uncharacterized protein n=1 Tax=Pseudomyxococcus hansupus TaxID=1297742 RepID=A0A0H4XF60_9BACT|nr:hypothetical protein A176_003729 [Myxococcus hansupus]
MEPPRGTVRGEATRSFRDAAWRLLGPRPLDCWFHCQTDMP